MPNWLTARSLTELGVIHGFSTAAAGDLKDPALRQRWLDELAPRLPLATATQVHGALAEWAAADRVDEADALLARAGLAVGIFTADCVPILLADPAAKLVAAVHAGWRGTLDGVVVAALTALLDAGAKVESLRAVLGPHIRPCCYEVGDDLAKRFENELGEQTVVRDGTPRLDLAAANVAILDGIGVDADRVELIDRCTSCSKDPAFFSYRREKELSGRQLSIVALR